MMVAFAWDTLIAIGTVAIVGATLVLAAVTWGLVHATRRLVRVAVADLRAQSRPVLLVRDRVPADRRGHGRGVVFNDATREVFVENVGRGPAFDVQAWLDDFDQPGPGYGVPEGARPQHGGMGGRLQTALGPTDLVPFVWSGLGEPREMLSGSFSYGDMSGSEYSTTFLVRFHPERGAELVHQRFQHDSQDDALGHSVT